MMNNDGTATIHVTITVESCDLPIASVGDEMTIDDLPALTTHVNPYGYVHDVLTVSKRTIINLWDLQVLKTLGFKDIIGNSLCVGSAIIILDGPITGH